MGTNFQQPAPYGQGNPYIQNQIDAFNAYKKGVNDAVNAKAPARAAPKFGTMDLLLGLVPALLSGKHGAGNYLASYLSGKMQGNEQQYQDKLAQFARDQQSAKDATNVNLQEASLYGDLANRYQSQQNFTDQMKSRDVDQALTEANRLNSQIETAAAAGKPTGIQSLFGSMNIQRQKAGLDPISQDEINAKVKEAKDTGLKMAAFKAVPALMRTINSNVNGEYDRVNKRKAINNLYKITQDYPGEFVDYIGLTDQDVADLKDALDQPTPAEEIQAIRRDTAKLLLGALPDKIKDEAAKRALTLDIDASRLKALNITLKYADQKAAAELANSLETLDKLKGGKAANGIQLSALNGYLSALKASANAIIKKQPIDAVTKVPKPLAGQDLDEYNAIQADIARVTEQMKPMSPAEKAATTQLKIGSKILGQTIKSVDELDLFRSAQNFLTDNPNLINEVARKLAEELSKLRKKP